MLVYQSVIAISQLENIPGITRPGPKGRGVCGPSRRRHSPLRCGENASSQFPEPRRIDPAISVDFRKHLEPRNAELAQYGQGFPCFSYDFLWFRMMQHPSFG